MILSARNLKKTFQDGDNTLQVLKGVNFDLDKGDILTINCLLYTSPSPRDATLSRMPSSA